MAESLFYGYAYTTPPPESTRVERSASGSNPVIRRYEVLTEADIAAIEREFQPLLDRIQREIDNPGASGIITIPPGQKRLVHFQGYCLDKGIAAPQTQEGFQLLPITNLLPGDALPFYGGLLQYGQASGRTNEVQGLIWRLVHGVNPEHEPIALYPNETQILNEAVPGGATAFYSYLKNKYQQSKTSVQALYQKEGRELVQDVVNRYVNPTFGGSGISVNLYRQDLNGSAQIEDYLNRLAQLPVDGKVENGSEYTLLANQVAARSVSTYDVRGLSIEIANQSTLPYNYDPLHYIALSTRMTQPVGHYPKEEDGEFIGGINRALQLLRDYAQLLDAEDYALIATGITAAIILRNPALLSALSRALGKLLKGGLAKVVVNAEKVLASASAPHKGSTFLGHALSKHAGRRPDVWGKMTGNQSTWHGQGLKHFNDIMNAPGKFMPKTDKTTGITFLEKWLPDGRGMRLNMDGTFKGLLD